MTVTKLQVENSIERKLLTNCITNTQYLRSIIPACKGEYLKAPFSRTVYKWIVDYYNQYDRAPNTDIQDIYMAHRLQVDEQEADIIGTFLSSLSDSAAPIANLDYEIQSSVDWLRLRSLEVMKEKLDLALQHKDYVEGESIVANYSKLTIHKADTIDFGDINPNEVENAFNDDSEILFSLPGAFGKQLGPIKRGDFVNLLSPAKMGKSMFLQDIGMWGMVSSCNVLELNYEMSRNQKMRRWWQRITASPKQSMDIKLPYFYKDSDADALYKVGYHEEYRKAAPTDSATVSQLWKEFRDQTPAGNYKLQCHISKTHGPKDIRNILVNMELYEGYVPDILIIDHPLLLKYGNGKGEGWENIGDLFAELRGIATEFNIAILTATHSTRAGYRASMLDETQTGKSIDILHHVTSCIAITSTKKEKEAGFYRSMQLVEREGRTYSDQCVIAHCLDLAMPHVDSRWLSELDSYQLPKEEKQERGD